MSARQGMGVAVLGVALLASVLFQISTREEVSELEGDVGRVTEIVCPSDPGCRKLAARIERRVDRGLPRPGSVLVPDGPNKTARGRAGADGTDGQVGIDGADGTNGRNATDAQVFAAVAAYCGTRNNCRGPQGERGGIGPPGNTPAVDDVADQVVGTLCGVPALGVLLGNLC